MKKAFTLIELLVVIAVIAILAAILFPVFAQAKTAAKRSADLSNTKQLTLACIQYMGDSDDVPPLYQQTPAGKTENTPGMLSWKDSTAPYVKDGGMPYNDGQKYSQTGGGGVYASPMAEMPWSGGSMSTSGAGEPGFQPGDGVSGFPAMNGGTGDATTRFPRSYALNEMAGANEMGSLAKGIMAATKEAANGTVTFPWNGQPAGATVLQDPSNTLLIVPTRYYVLAIDSTRMYQTCSVEGHPRSSPRVTGAPPYSAIRSTRNRNLTGGFFDGHVKNVNGASTIYKDMWDDQAAWDATFHLPAGTSAKSDGDEAMKVIEWKTGL